jgi:single-strand binding protein
MASRSLNRVILIGNLTRDPELKYTQQGTAICTFGLATNRSWTTNTGEHREEAQYHRVVAWQKLAELCGKLLTKGRKVYVEGRLTYRTFTGRDGQQKTIAEIV